MKNKQQNDFVPKTPLQLMAEDLRILHGQQQFYTEMLDDSEYNKLIEIELGYISRAKAQLEWFRERRDAAPNKLQELKASVLLLQERILLERQRSMTVAREAKPVATFTPKPTDGLTIAQRLAVAALMQGAGFSREKALETIGANNKL